MTQQICFVESASLTSELFTSVCCSSAQCCCRVLIELHSWSKWFMGCANFFSNVLSHSIFSPAEIYIFQFLLVALLTNRQNILKLTKNFFKNCRNFLHLQTLSNCGNLNLKKYIWIELWTYFFWPNVTVFLFCGVFVAYFWWSGTEYAIVSVWKCETH